MNQSILLSDRLASTSVLLYERPTCKYHPIRVPSTTLVEIMEVFTCASYFINVKSWTVYGEDQLSATTRVKSLWPAFKRAVVGAMFVFEGLNSSCFSRLKLHLNYCLQAIILPLLETALSFDIGLGDINLALSFFLGGTGSHLLVPLVM